MMYVVKIKMFDLNGRDVLLEGSSHGDLQIKDCSWDVRDMMVVAP